MNRTERAQVADETVAVLERGSYVSPTGQAVMLGPQIQRCISDTAYFGPGAFDDALQRERPPRHDTIIEVVNETTLTGAYSLVTAGYFKRIGVLNFASAKRPGGGFLNGSAAQEESLARSSALYVSLQQQPVFYVEHRRMKGSTYSDRMIYSPGCPVFRDDDGRLLDAPYTVDFITCAAPNAGAMRRSRRGRLPGVLRQRAGKILALAAQMKCDALILGAWGCGVFRNEPILVAGIFGELLTGKGPYVQQFRHVRFSVLDVTPQLATYRAFTLLAQMGHG